MDQLTSKQITEWEAYHTIDPIGKWRDDFQTAKLESLIINIVTSLYKKKGTRVKLTTPDEFMPKWGEKKKQQIVDQQEVAKRIKSIFGSISKEQEKKVRQSTRIPVSKQKPKQ